MELLLTVTYEPPSIEEAIPLIKIKSSKKSNSGVIGSIQDIRRKNMNMDFLIFKLFIIKVANINEYFTLIFFIWKALKILFIIFFQYVLNKKKGLINSPFLKLL